MTRRAVVYYEVGATREEKIKALREGLTDCAYELADLGCSIEEINDALDVAMSAAEWECSEQRA